MSLLDRSPVFIVGAQRSGTTWVQRLLAAHPAIVSGQESHLFSGYLAPLWRRWQAEHDLRLTGRTIGLACYVTEEEFVEESRRLARRVFATVERAKPGARLLVEKTPDHGLHLPLIRRLFPDAIVIHVLRDGRDVAASLRDAARRPWGRAWASGSAEEAARRWVEWVGAIRRDLDGFPRTRTVRYEDLAADGPAVLADLYRFLGAPLPPHLVKSIYQAAQCGGRATGGQDSLVLEGECRGKAPGEPDGFFRRGRVGGWKTDLSSEEQASVHAAAGKLLAELGYAGDSAAAAAVSERPPAPEPAAERPGTFVSAARPDDVLWTRPRRMSVLDDTNAQMLPRERLYLYATILALAPERCLEVGVSQGGSTRIIHAALTDLGRGRLVALDPAPALTYLPETLEDRVTFLTGPSPAALGQARDLAGGLFDFVLLDGDHSEEGVRRDLEGLAAVTRPGALVLAHDAYCPSVAAGIDAVLKAGLGYADVGVVSTTRHPGRVGENEVVFAGFRLLVRTGGLPCRSDAGRDGSQPVASLEENGAAAAPSLDGYPGMASHEERQYCREFAAGHYDGSGAIVDLGCWLGCTTAALAEGLTRNPGVKAGRVIHAYDCFTWRLYMNECVRGTGLEGVHHPRQSFLPEFLRRTRPWEKYIQVHAGDMAECRWDGGPITFLMVDALKSVALARNVLRTFYPALAAGALVVQQDFAHCFTPWIHLIHYFLRDYFTVAYDVPRSCGLVFRLGRPIPATAAAKSDWLTRAPAETIRQAFRHSMSLVEPAKQGGVAAAEVMMFRYRGDCEEAARTLERRRKQFPGDSELGAAEAELAALGRPLSEVAPPAVAAISHGEAGVLRFGRPAPVGGR